MADTFLRENDELVRSERIEISCKDSPKGKIDAWMLRKIIWFAALPFVIGIGAIAAHYVKNKEPSNYRRQVNAVA